MSVPVEPVSHRPGDTDNALLRKILDRLTYGVPFIGSGGELPPGVEIVAVANWPVIQHVEVVNWPGTQHVEVINWPASVAVNNFPGTVGVSNFPAIQVISGAVSVVNFPATQPVSGTVNVGNFPATQPVSGSVSVSNFPAAYLVAGTVNSHATDPVTGDKAWVDAYHNLRVAKTVRLIGASFSGPALDTQFWAATLTGTGSAVASAGVLTVRTGSTANSTAQVASVRRARHIAGTKNMARCVMKLTDTGAVNNKRNWGIGDANNGYFFQLDGTTLKAVTRAGGVDTSGTIAFTVDTNFHTYEIIYSMARADFYIDGLRYYSVTAIGTASLLTQDMALPLLAQSVNSGGGTTDAGLIFGNLFVERFGELATDTKALNIAAATTTVCKNIAGRLHRIIVGNPAGTVTIYDNTAASGTLISTITLSGGGQLPTVFEFGVSFGTGLTIVTSSGSVNLTVVYE